MANNVKIIREYRGLSQGKLAELVGHDQSTIHKIETDKRGLSKGWMDKLSVPLRCLAYQLMQDDLDLSTLSISPLLKHKNESTLPESQVTNRMPLYAKVKAGVEKVDISAGPSGTVPIPERLRHVENVFAVLIVNSAVNKLDDNDMAYVAPLPMPVEGKLACVMYQDGTAEVFRYKGRTATEWKFERDLPKASSFSISASKINDVMIVHGAEFINQ